MAPPINDDFADAQEVLSGILEDEGLSGTLVDATDEANWEGLAGYGAAGQVPFVWYHFTTPADASQLYWKITKTGGDAGFFPGADLYSGSAPTDYNDLTYIDSIGNGTGTPPADRVIPLTGATDYWVVVYTYNADGTEGTYTIDFQLVPSYLYEEWEELDPAIWRIGNSSAPTSGPWSISSAESFSGATSVKYEGDGSAHRGLIYQDQISGNQNAVEYWIAYKFFVDDWAPIDAASSYPIYLPCFLVGPNSAAGTDLDIYLEATSSSTGHLHVNSGGTFTPISISAGTWHEVRISLTRTGSNITIDEIVDGVQVSTNYAKGTLAANPSGVFWRHQTWNTAGIVYVDPVIYSVVGDPGPISAGADTIDAPFIASTTTVFAPSLLPSLDVPFIAPTGGTFDPLLAGDFDIPAPFIASTTSVFAPTVVLANRARVTQAGAEALVSPTDSDARVTQAGVEVVYVGDGGEARVTQVGVEAVVRRLHETTHVVIIDPSLKMP